MPMATALVCFDSNDPSQSTQAEQPLLKILLVVQ